MGYIKTNTCKEIIATLQDKAIDSITLKPNNVHIELDARYVKMEDVIHVLISHLKDGAPEKLINELQQ